MFRKDFFGGGQNGIESNSDEGEDAAEVEAELFPSAIWMLVTGLSSCRAAGGPFLRGIGVVGWAICVNCGCE